MKSHEWKPRCHNINGEHWELWRADGRYQGAAYKYYMAYKAYPMYGKPALFPTLSLAGKYIEECVNENCT